MDELTLLLEECCALFRTRDEYAILMDYLPNVSRFTLEERQAVNDCIEEVFRPVYRHMRAEVNTITDLDLECYCMCALGVETAVIAECMTVSKEAIRVRKQRMINKLPKEWRALIKGKRKMDKTKEERPAIKEPLLQRKIVKERMTFSQAVGSCLRKYFTFKGRARRSEYWYFYLFVSCLLVSYKLIKGMVKSFVIPDVSVAVQEWLKMGNNVVGWMMSIGVMIPMLTVTARRMHDRGDSTWVSFAIYLLPWVLCAGMDIYYDNWGREVLYDITMTLDESVGMLTTMLLFVFFELVAATMRMVMCAKPGTVGRNAYGADPIRYVSEFTV